VNEVDKRKTNRLTKLLD